MLKKQSRLTMTERAERHDVGDVYLWTCIDQKTKLHARFPDRQAVGRQRPAVHDGRCRPAGVPQAARSDAQASSPASYQPIVQISTDGFAAYPEAVDLAFGPYVKYGTIIKEYRNANMIYTPSEMVGTKRTGIAGHRRPRAAHDMHQARRAAERHATAVPEAAQPADLLLLQEAPQPGSGFRHVRGLLQLLLADPEAGQERTEARRTAAMMAGLAGHVWSFD